MPMHLRVKSLSLTQQLLRQSFLDPDIGTALHHLSTSPVHGSKHLCTECGRLPGPWQEFAAGAANTLQTWKQLLLASSRASSAARRASCSMWLCAQHPPGLEMVQPVTGTVQAHWLAALKLQACWLLMSASLDLISY